MGTLFDRLNHELEAFGRRAQAALDEGKLQIELMRLRRQRDLAARDLGFLIHRRERGREFEPRRVDALLLRLDAFGEEIARLEQQIAAAREQRQAHEQARRAGAAAGAPGDPPA
jgi:hypothetical protein